MRNALAILVFLTLMAMPAEAEIPYRYSIQEGFILAIDDVSPRSVPHDDPIAWAVLDELAKVLESDRFRIPVDYGRTLAWNQGVRLTQGMSRDDHLVLYRSARRHEASRPMPANVLFIRVSARNDNATVRLDWVDLSRGESEVRYASEPTRIGSDAPANELRPFFERIGQDLLLRLGPAPPRGYGDVPPPWLIEPIRYRIDFRDLPEDVRFEAFDAMTVEFDHFLSDEVEFESDDRLVVSYETIAPSWWVAERLLEVFADLAVAVTVEPRSNGLRIEPME